MSLIDLLIAPITEDNIVNNIRLEKKSPIPFASKIAVQALRVCFLSCNFSSVFFIGNLLPLFILACFLVDYSV